MRQAQEPSLCWCIYRATDKIRPPTTRSGFPDPVRGRYKGREYQSWERQGLSTIQGQMILVSFRIGTDKKLWHLSLEAVGENTQQRRG